MKLISTFLFIWLSIFSVARAKPQFEGWGGISVSSKKSIGGKHVAILIENGDYKYLRKLRAPQNDVNAVASKLLQLGFKVIILHNPTAKKIKQAIKSANPKSGRGTLLTFYYSGHGGELLNQNSIILTDFNPQDLHSSSSILSLQEILLLLSKSNFEKILVALDACRNLYEEKKVSYNNRANEKGVNIRGFRVEPAKSDGVHSLNRREYAVLYSTSKREIALETTKEGISPFTKAFLLALGREKSFLSAMLLTKRITEQITNYKQSPDIQIKWNTNLSYKETLKTSYRGRFLLRENAQLNWFANSKEKLAKMSYSIGDALRRQYILRLNQEDYSECKKQRKNNFFWSVSLINIEYCLLPEIGYRSNDQRGSIFRFRNPSAYLMGYYESANWQIDLDFDGEPETLTTAYMHADMSLMFQSKLGSFDFRGKIGSNINFLGVMDFNKDGILDIFITVNDGRGSDNLLILNGTTLLNKIGDFKNCYTRDFQKDKACAKQKKFSYKLIGSIFDPQSKESYSGSDILQAVLYADWNIKNWKIGEHGDLILTTFSPTWGYERFQPSNYMMNKVISFDQNTGNLSIFLRGTIDKRLTLQTIQERIN